MPHTPNYPSLKPLPAPKVASKKAHTPKGWVTTQDYEQRQFAQAWKAKKP